MVVLDVLPYALFAKVVHARSAAWICKDFEADWTLALLDQGEESLFALPRVVVHPRRAAPSGDTI
jgi:hypothetical protein